MGPTKVKAGATGKGSNKRSQKPAASGSLGSSSRIKKKTPSKVPRKAPEQQKTKSASSHAASNKKKKRVYTAKELGIPELNGIVPAGVTKPPNMKKGKNFVDDGEGMNAILAMVMAEKEGNIESKMMRARQLEEVREARRAEMETRTDHKKAAMEARKQGIKEDGKKKRHSVSEGGEFQGFGNDEVKKPASKPYKQRKRVSFG